MSDRDLQVAGVKAISFRKAVTQCNLDQIADMVKEIITDEWFRERVEGVPDRLYRCESLIEFITAKPVKGCGWPLEKITHLLKQSGNEEVLAMWIDAITPPHGGDRKSEEVKIKPDIIRLDRKYGTSKADILVRLKRERGDLYSRVIAKELSANAAAIEAGWRRKPTPLAQLRSWWAKASSEEKAAFLEEIDFSTAKADK
jgi:hypothetical protein